MIKKPNTNSIFKKYSFKLVFYGIIYKKCSIWHVPFGWKKLLLNQNLGHNCWIISVLSSHLADTYRNF